MRNMPAYIDVSYGGMHVLAKTERCPSCARHIGRERATFSCSAKPVYRYPLFLTSDGFYVASSKFRTFAIDNGFTGVEFIPLENGRFVLKVARKVNYDLTKAWVNQEDWCPVCETFRRNLTAGGTHVLDAAEAPIGDLEVVESAQRWGDEFGLRTAQCPDLLVGVAAGKIIKAAKLRAVSVYFEPRKLPI